MKSVRSFVAILCGVLLLFAALVQRPAAAEDGTPPVVEAGIAEINKYGNLILTIGFESMIELGYEPADVISVKIGDSEMEMPIATSYSDVDSGEPICCFKTSSKGIKVVVLAVNAGDLATRMGVAERRSIDADPGYEWVFANVQKDDVTVTISMAEKQGYAQEYELHQLVGTRSNVRSDYKNLSDAEYANFRAVETTGMGRGTLFRSSSPVNPVLNRSREADEALLLASVRTVMNMADSEEAMNAFADYSLTHYSECDVIALNMGMDFTSSDFRQKLADGFRYLSAHDGPYLIHCIEGKDRAGIAAALLECLMGASVDEVIADYMLTYANFYGVSPGTPQYRQIAAGNIEASLARAFGIPSIRGENTDLQALAERYLREIGMSGEEISLLKQRLAADYGGMNESAA